jgi:antitoxin (DNA-binding transcriptional repressor) of toxin-antitoxin stability system
MMRVRSDEIRRKLPAVVRAVERDGEHVELLRYEEPVAVIVPVDWHKKAVTALGEQESRCG